MVVAAALAPTRLPAQHQHGCDSAAAAPARSARRYTAADVQFMQHMIGHHAQALTMAAMVPARTEAGAIRQLAQRIEVSQRDEIALMQRWLAVRHETVPAADPSHHHEGADTAHEVLMPGMLTPAELDRLAASHGADFDRRFLTFMIRHHEGALTMVANLFATTGAGQEAEAFRFASDVDSDQRAEIRRMRALLAQLPPDSTRS